MSMSRIGPATWWNGNEAVTEVDEAIYVLPVVESVGVRLFDTINKSEKNWVILL
jgi:hypothetical protein